MRAALWCPLRDARPAMDELADVFTFPRVRIAAGVDTDQPCDGSAASNLASRTRHFAV